MTLNSAEWFSNQAVLAVTIDAQSVFNEVGALGWLTNSIVVGLILFMARAATKDVKLVPSGMQNFFELLVEFLYSQVEAIVGKKIAPKVFPLLATIFIYVVISNWFGLLPGVGTIGFGEKAAFLTLDPGGHPVPLLRPATADLNLTLGMALVFVLVWTWITIRETGVVGFIKHTFGPKGGLTGFVGMAIVPIFLFVGVIEIISIVLRPVSLSLRLFGNVFAGESLLHAMSNLGETFGLGPILSFLSSVVLPLPFYFLELLVGILQAVVFALLCAVYIQLSTTHDEAEH